MQEKLIKYYRDALNYWKGVSVKNKRYTIGAAASVVAVAIILSVVINVAKSGYVVIYPGMSGAESAELLSTLGIRNVPTRTTASGEVMVPTSARDGLLVELAAQGFPKSTLTYNVFSDSSGFTTTEFERKQYLLFQLQERLQGTLQMIDNVARATVTLNVPQNNNYVWDDNKQASTASVLLTFKGGNRISGESIAGIKNLVSSAVPNLSPDNVSVIDSSTGNELKDPNASANSVEYEIKRMGLENEVETKIAEKIRGVLTLGYSPEDMRIEATVSLDYDKMLTESMQYIGDEDNKGVLQSEQLSAVGGSNIQSGGVVGEENNSDIPIYVQNDDGTVGYVDYTKNNEYLVSYIKSQVEKDNATLKEASVAITLRDNNLTDQKKAQLIESASMASAVSRDKISIVPFEAVQIVTPTGIATILSNPIVLASIAGVVLLLIVIIILLLMSHRKKQAALIAGAEQETLVVDGVKFNNDTEALAYRAQLKEAAQASINSKESIIVNEVKEFAAKNPDITAQLVRTWLKGEEVTA